MGLISFFSAVGSFIGSAISAFGTAVGGFVKGALHLIGKLSVPGETLIRAISAVSNIIHTIAEFLGIKSESDPEILGAKAAQSEKKLDDFDQDVEAYIKYLTEEVELDRERFDRLTGNEKLECKVIGMSLETKAVEEKIGGINISPECLEAMIKIQIGGIDIDAKELVGFVQELKSAGITDLNDAVEYLEGKGESDRIKTGEVFAAVLGENADEKIDELKDAVRKFGEESL